MSQGPFEARDPVAARADRFMDELESLYRELEPAAGGTDVELYHRSSVTLRASRRTGATIAAIDHGRDDGIAVRTRAGTKGPVGFAASSGFDATIARWALDRCLRSAAESRDSAESWPARVTTPRIDRDEAAVLPPAGELTAWLAAATEHLNEPGKPTGRWGAPLESRVEVATTVETWVGTGGLRASRVRTRAWGMVRTRGLDADRSLPRPVIISRRRWEDLPTDGWRAVLEDRLGTDLPQGQVPDGRIPVLFNPECSASLVAALVKVLHNRDRARVVEVGRAWQLMDDPADPAALFGGEFDDAGFTTRRRVLADGVRTTGSIAGKGHLRRPSFRDRPVPMAFHAVVRTDPGSPPSRGVLITESSLHPLEPDRWLLEVEGATLDEGVPTGALTRAFIVVSPLDLVRRCSAAVGPARPSHLGIKTPALLFDDLTLQRPG